MDPDHNYPLILSSKATEDGWEHRIQLASGTRILRSESLDLQSSDLIDWLAFRRALIASQEYPSALAIACLDPAQSTAFQLLVSAIDFCCQGGVEDQEIAAFQSAIALYLSSLPDTEIGQSISARVTTLCGDYHIPLTP
jgi:hypothetical protein